MATSTLNGFDRSRCFKMGGELNEVFSFLKASLTAVFHNICLATFFKREVRDVAIGLKPQINRR